MVAYEKRLKEAMDDAGVSVAKLADTLGVTYQAVKKVLNSGSGTFSAVNHARAAKFLNVDSDWLALGEGHKARRDATDDSPLNGINKAEFDSLPEAEKKEIYAIIQMKIDRFNQNKSSAASA